MQGCRASSERNSRAVLWNASAERSEIFLAQCQPGPPSRVRHICRGWPRTDSALRPGSIRRCFVRFPSRCRYHQETDHNRGPTDIFEQRRDATMPSTPGCQPRAPATNGRITRGIELIVDLLCGCGKDLCFHVLTFAICCRSSSAASPVASLSSCVSSSRKDFSAVLKRPAAFNRGPSR